jgi:hypothetical protein
VHLLLCGTAFAECDASAWHHYEGVKLWKFAGTDAYFYSTNRMEIDADGAPNAYHPQDTGIDALGNAGFPPARPGDRGWTNVLVVDPADSSRPYVQTTGEFAGYFVSKTSLQDKSLRETDPSRYVDARVVPYIVFPGAFHSIKGTGDYGDFAAVRNLSNGKQSPAIVADGGNRNDPLGEVSIGLAEALGGTNVSPRNGSGKPPGPFLYVVFPKSRAQPAWRVTRAQMEKHANEQLGRLGGWDKIMGCLR